MDKIFICAEGTSNKFWGYKVSGLTVTCKWGRLGTAGQLKNFSFDSQYDLDKFIGDKTNEKLDKGYEEKSPEQLELETVVAQTIGVGNKLERIHFVQVKGKKMTILDPKKDKKILHDPNMQPLVYALISGRRKDKDDWDSAPSREFLLSLNDAKIIKTDVGVNNIHFSGAFLSAGDRRETLVIESELPVDVNDEAQAMSQAVGQCIGKLLL